MKEFLITVNGKSYEVKVEELNGKQNVVPIPAPQATPKVEPIPSPSAVKPEVKPVQQAGAAGKNVIKCPMPGTIIKINVNVGDTVKPGSVLCILEAMKMENEIMAPENGVVASVNTTQGASVNSGDLLFTID